MTDTENNMAASEAIKQLIKDHEKLMLVAYKDAAGNWTIGYGHKMRPDEDQIALSISPKAADEIFEKDLAEAESHVRDLVKVPLQQGQYDALVSFVYNVGRDALRRSTLLKKLNAGDYIGASDEFGRWVYADGKQLGGLIKRRSDERDFFTMESS